MIEIFDEVPKDKYKISIGGQTVEEFMERYEDERLTEPLEIEVEDKKKNFSFAVHIDESFGCCGKLYMYDFECKSKKQAKILLTIGNAISEYLGYTYIGFVHLSTSWPVSISSDVGFREAFSFKNKRSENILSEMYKILE